MNSTIYTILLCIFCLFFNTESLAQNDENESLQNLKPCAYDLVEKEYAAKDPRYMIEKMDKRRAFRTYLKEMKSRRSMLPIYNMPVVVHIIHAGAELGTEANPLDETVRSIVEQASDRFRHAHNGADNYSNPNYGADTEIELCMSNFDPIGNYTTGVTRHYLPDLAIGTYNEVANGLNALAWDKSKYINLYIMTDMTNASGVYLGGFDFTIYTSGAFWSGLIAHELGHYFDLDHTFTPQENCVNNDCTLDGDGICDTPPKSVSGFFGATCASPGNSCTTDDDDTSNNNPYRPTQNGGLGDQPDMLANYMDYSGSCWDAFTLEQKARMRMDISSSRLSINNHSAIACAAPSIPANEVSIQGFTMNQQDICSASFTALVKLKNLGSQTLNSATIKVEINDNLILNNGWTGTLGPNSSVDVILDNAALLLVQGDNFVKVTVENPNGNQDVNLYDNVAYGRAQLVYNGTCLEVNTCSNFNPQSNNSPPQSTILNFSGNLPEINSNSNGAAICVKVRGDVSYSQERFNITGENGSGTIYATTEFGTDCGGYTAEVCFQIPVSDYQNWKADGTITITLTPVSGEINPILCNNNEACGRIIVPEAVACSGLVAISSNDGMGSLRQNIECAEVNGVINLDHAQIPDTIILASPILINRNMVIKGINGSDVIIKAAPSSPVFEIENGASVTLEGFKLMSSKEVSNGTAIINGGTLLLRNMLIVENQEGGILVQNNGTLNIDGRVDLIQNE
jgi:hypothetical protein